MNMFGFFELSKYKIISEKGISLLFSETDDGNVNMDNFVSSIFIRHTFL